MSAILCVYRPDLAPFMCDEATIAVPCIHKLDYTLKQYMSFTEAMSNKADELNKLKDKGTIKYMYMYIPNNITVDIIPTYILHNTHYICTQSLLRMPL